MVYIIDKFINYFIYIFLIHSCFRIPFRKNKLFHVLSGAFCVVFGILDVYLGQEYMSVFIIWAVFAMLLLFEDKSWHLMLLTIALTWFMGMMDTFSSIFIQVIFLGSAVPKAMLTWAELLAYPISFGIELMLYLMVLKKTGVYLNEIKLTYKIGILLMTLIFELVVVGVFGVYYDNPNNYTWYLHVRFVLCLIGAIYSLYITLELAVKNYLYNKQNRYLELALDIQQNQYLYQKEKDLDLRRFRHDLVNHIGAVKELLYHKQYEQANTYIDEIWNVTECLSNNVNSGDDYLDAILNYYFYICEKANVSFEISGKLKSPIEMDVMDITALLGNALQNAYEAATKENDKIVKFEVVDHEREIFFAICNSCDKENIQADFSMETSKDDKENHGFGLGNIMSVVNKYKGECYFSIDKDANVTMFRIDISIPRGSQL